MYFKTKLKVFVKNEFFAPTVTKALSTQSLRYNIK